MVVHVACVPDLMSRHNDHVVHVSFYVLALSLLEW